MQAKHSCTLESKGKSGEGGEIAQWLRVRAAAWRGFNTSFQEAETGIPLNWRPAWSTARELHNKETLS